MGVCLSCLGRSPQESSDPSESSRLLHDDPYQPRYGGTAPLRPVSSPPQPDPEQLRLEREALDRICTLASNKLIDVTHAAQAEQPVPSMDQHYARLFRESFRVHDFGNPPTIAGYPFNPTFDGESPGRDAYDSAVDDGEGERQRAAAAARSWLRDAVEDVSTGKKWDPKTVQKIAGKLTFSFDDF